VLSRRQLLVANLCFPSKVSSSISVDGRALRVTGAVIGQTERLAPFSGHPGQIIEAAVEFYMSSGFVCQDLFLSDPVSSRYRAVVLTYDRARLSSRKAIWSASI
jgi:hypothetical protein